jgi:hypothetical protein
MSWLGGVHGLELHRPGALSVAGACMLDRLYALGALARTPMPFAYEVTARR